MPSSSPALLSRLVTLRSSELGVRFPLGWLWVTMTAVARSRKGSAKTSDVPGWLTQLDYSLEGSAEGCIMQLFVSMGLYGTGELHKVAGTENQNPQISLGDRFQGVGMENSTTRLTRHSSCMI